MSDFSAFGNLERSSWLDAKLAFGYVELFARASDQAINSLLDAADASLDFSPAMLAFARRRAPGATFIEADAQRLPFEAFEFDFVVSNLGVCHVPDQPRALAEVRRVLRKGGKFAMTVWCGPEASPCFAAVYGVIKAHGHPDVSVPSGPDFHQFARRGAGVELLADAGFSNIDVTTVDCVWDLNSPDQLFEIYARGRSAWPCCWLTNHLKILPPSVPN